MNNIPLNILKNHLDEVREFMFHEKCIDRLEIAKSRLLNFNKLCEHQGLSHRISEKTRDVAIDILDRLCGCGESVPDIDFTEYGDIYLIWTIYSGKYDLTVRIDSDGEITMGCDCFLSIRVDDLVWCIQATFEEFRHD